MASFKQITQTSVVTKAVRQVFANTSRILDSFGFANPTRSVLGRQFSWDVYNDTRKPMKGRAPGATSARRRRNPIGRVTCTMPRFRERLPIPYEDINGQRRLGRNAGEQDRLGADYVARQELVAGQYAVNAAVLLTAGMMRGKLYYHGSGDEEYYDFTSTDAKFTLDFQLPAANIGNLNGIIDKSWDDPTADIPKHIEQIDKAMVQGPGTRLERVKLSSTMWGYVLDNDAVQARAGIGNPAFQTYTREIGTNPENGLPVTTKVGTITAVPWVQFEISDEVIEVGAEGSETSTQLVPDTNAWFGPAPSTDIFEMVQGSEPFVDREGGPVQEGVGLYGYTKTVDDPPELEIHSGMNMIPALYVPSATMWGTVVF